MPPSHKNAKTLGIKVSISPIFYEQIFCTKVFCTPFMCLQFGFVIFRRKDFGTKAANKMLEKLTQDFKEFYNDVQIAAASDEKSVKCKID
jgi:hypothetical protein